MQHGITLPNFGEYGDAQVLADLAATAEEAGWEGVFVWDHIVFDRHHPMRVVDPWVALAAMAMVTRRVRLGPLVTPLARRRPWKLARETVSIDHLSHGRLILGVGLGDPADHEFAAFGEEPEPRVRAAKLDEGLDVLTGLWRGVPFRYHGSHYHLDDMTFLPPPRQSPRIPIWVAGLWPHRAPFRRAARWDGVVPIKLDGPMSPHDVEQISGYIQTLRDGSDPFDLAFWDGCTPGPTGARTIAPYAEAGVTWWLEGLHTARGSLEAMRTRIKAGPAA